MNEKTMTEPDSTRHRISTSFSSTEIAAMNELFNVLRRGGDASVIARSHEVKKVMTKFHSAAERLGTP